MPQRAHLPRLALLLTKSIFVKDGNFAKEVKFTKDGDLAVGNKFADESIFAKPMAFP